jgi:hypothetical protein
MRRDTNWGRAFFISVLSDPMNQKRVEVEINGDWYPATLRFDGKAAAIFLDDSRLLESISGIDEDLDSIEASIEDGQRLKVRLLLDLDRRLTELERQIERRDDYESEQREQS